MNQNQPPYHTLWTIGHSTHSAETFLEMLLESDIEVLADIRRHPGSGKYPHFNQEYLRELVEKNGIGYVHISMLAGRRSQHKSSPNTVWKNRSFRAYADYMETEAFLTGIRELIDIATEKRTAIMCSEAVWWRCHRSMVSDYMKSIGWTVIHIMGKNQSKPHPYTAPARIIAGKLHYGSDTASSDTTSSDTVSSEAATEDSLSETTGKA